MAEGVDTSHRVQVEARGQPVAIISLHHVGLGVKLRALDLVASTFTQ